jgi:hypothetical protein
VQSDFTKSCSETSNQGQNGTANLKKGKALEDDKERQNVTDHASKLSEAQRRLQRLEQVVASLVDESAAPPKVSDQPTPPYSDQSAGGMYTSEQRETQPQQLSDIPLNGRLEVRGIEANYSGGTHWETILGNVCVLIS